MNFQIANDVRLVKTIYYFRCLSGELLSCDLGEYQDDIGSSECKKCSLGQYDIRNETDNESVNCHFCPENHYCVNGIINKCPEDTFSPAGSVRCESEFDFNCGIGNYKKNGTCSNCPSGFHCPDGIDLFECPTETYSLNGWHQCQFCPEGFIASYTKSECLVQGIDMLTAFYFKNFFDVS